MEIIAKTKEGCLIQASKHEVKEILAAITGKAPDELSIGQKLPAIDYAATITQIKKLGNNCDYQLLLQKVEEFNEVVNGLKLSIQSASSIRV